MIALLFLGNITICNLIWIASMVLTTRLVKFTVDNVTLGLGPRLFSSRSELLTIRLLPLGASVVSPETEPANQPPLIKNLAMLLGGWVLPLATALLMLGPLQAEHSLFRTYRELLQIVTFRGSAIWDHYLAMDEMPRLGATAAKMIALNLLPYPGSTGGRVLALLTREPRLFLRSLLCGRQGP